jgi:hypothetical protein
MENTHCFNDMMLGVVGQYSRWRDLRHRKPLAWMMVSLVCAQTVCHEDRASRVCAVRS